MAKVKKKEEPPHINILKKEAKLFLEKKKLKGKDFEYCKDKHTTYLNKIIDAKNRNIEFTIPFKHFIKLCKKKRCMYSGKVFVPATHNRSSFERVDNTKGYTKNNTIVCLSRLNGLKSGAEIEELLSMFKYIKNANKRNKRNRNKT